MALAQVIQPYNALSDAKETVAAYCRVSSKSTDQLHSYRAQVTYYTNLISSNPEWELVDIYADKGITGTSIDKRDEFKRMMADCRAGKIKRILVKSVSRFARNSIELIEATRELKQLGVVVVFEEQGIDTSQMLGEMHLTMFAIAAQEESRSISNNMRWSYQKRMENGTFQGCCSPFGYSLINGKLVVNKDEANIVKLIFQLRLSGMSRFRIAQYLEDHHIPSVRGDKWSDQTIRYILSNEKYTGDMVLQKKYTPSELPFKKKLNRGEAPQYYVENSHEGIIDQETFSNAQILVAPRTRPQIPHMFTHRIVCPDCGRHFRHIAASGKSYWLCPYKINKISDCRSIRLPEIKIMEAFINMASKLYLYQDPILLSSLSLLREIEDKQISGNKKLYEINQSVLELNDKTLILQRLNSKGYIDTEEYNRQNSELTIERQNLMKERKKLLGGHSSTALIEKMLALQEQIGAWGGPLTKFDFKQFDSIVYKVIPINEREILFQLHSGLELTEVIPS